MSAAEFVLWQAFYLRYGFEVDRLEWASANAGAAAARSMGSTVKARDLVPKFGDGGSTHGQIMSFFDSLVKPGANGEQ